MGHMFPCVLGSLFQERLIRYSWNFPQCVWKRQTGEVVWINLFVWQGFRNAFIIFFNGRILHVTYNYLGQIRLLKHKSYCFLNGSLNCIYNKQRRSLAYKKKIVIVPELSVSWKLWRLWYTNSDFPRQTFISRLIATH